MRRFLVVEDDVYLADLLSEVCEDLCKAEVLLANGDTATEILEQEHLDLAVIDVVMPERLGFDVVCEAARCNVPGLLISGYDEADSWCERFGVPHLKKPFGLQSFVELTEFVLADKETNIARIRKACTVIHEDREKNRKILHHSQPFPQESLLLHQRIKTYLA
jgi:CheY-like chemotaxis protein